MPCNGKFPTIISIITMFAIGVPAVAGSDFLAALLLSAAIAASVAAVMLSSRFLTRSLLKGCRHRSHLSSAIQNTAVCKGPCQSVSRQDAVCSRQSGNCRYPCRANYMADGECYRRRCFAVVTLHRVS